MKEESFEGKLTKETENNGYGSLSLETKQESRAENSAYIIVCHWRGGRFKGENN